MMNRNSKTNFEDMKEGDLLTFYNKLGYPMKRRIEEINEEGLPIVDIHGEPTTIQEVDFIRFARRFKGEWKYI
jgi:hypothetical protein